MALASRNPDQDRDDDLLTKAEVADLLRVRPASVSRWIAQGLFPVRRPSPRTLRIRRADLDLLFRPDALDRMADEDVPIPPPRPWTHDPATVNHELIASLEASRKPLTLRERKELDDLLRRVAELNERILKRRGGRPLPPSWPLIRQSREER